MIKEFQHKLTDDDLLNAPKVLRRFIYVQNPAVYDFQCLICGGKNIEWSEFESHIWCQDCNKDVFIPYKYAGVFGGPIPANISQLLGLCFDRFDLESKRVLKAPIESLSPEQLINKNRFEKLGEILDDDISRWEDTWFFHEELEKYKLEINQKLE